MFIKIVKTIKNGIKIKKIYFLNKVFFFEYIGKRVDKKEIFFGLIKTLRAKYHIPQIKILKLMNIPIIKSFRKDFIEKIYFFNILFKTKDHRYDFLNKYKKYILPEDKNIFILCGHHGESYLISAFLIETLLKKYKNTKFLCYSTCHKKMFELFWDGILPEIQILPNFKVPRADTEFEFEGKKVVKIYPSDSGLDKHIFNKFIELLDILPSEVTKKDLVYKNGELDEINKKINSLNLNLDNFIFIAPEADSFGEMDDDFWINITQKLNELGYDIYINSIKPKKWMEKYEHTLLSHKEVVSLAKLSCGIITVRSGFSEILSYLDKPMFVLYKNLYTSNNELMDKTIKSLSIKGYPFVHSDLIFEYNCHKIDDNMLIGNIVDKISKL